LYFYCNFRINNNIAPIEVVLFIYDIYHFLGVTAPNWIIKQIKKLFVRYY